LALISGGEAARTGCHDNRPVTIRIFSLFFARWPTGREMSFCPIKQALCVTPPAVFKTGAIGRSATPPSLLGGSASATHVDSRGDNRRPSWTVRVTACVTDSRRSPQPCTSYRRSRQEQDERAVSLDVFGRLWSGSRSSSTGDPWSRSVDPSTRTQPSVSSRKITSRRGAHCSSAGNRAGSN
jgi:hypothetical protein